LVGIIFGGVGGWIFGAELLKEIQNNARILKYLTDIKIS